MEVSCFAYCEAPTKTLAKFVPTQAWLWLWFTQHGPTSCPLPVGELVAARCRGTKAAPDVIEATGTRSHSCSRTPCAGDGCDLFPVRPPPPDVRAHMAAISMCKFHLVSRSQAGDVRANLRPLWQSANSMMQQTQLLQHCTQKQQFFSSWHKRYMHGDNSECSGNNNKMVMRLTVAQPIVATSSTPG